MPAGAKDINVLGLNVYRLAAGGLVAGMLSRDWAARSALTTCTAMPALIDPEPYSYSGPECIGWGDARPDFCNIY